MRIQLLIWLVLLLLVTGVTAQDDVECDTEAIQVQFRQRMDAADNDVAIQDAKLGLQQRLARCSEPFVLRYDFSARLSGFDYIEEYGAELEVVNDPTGSGRGEVLRGTITEESTEFEEYFAYPEKEIGFQTFPCRIQQDVWMDAKLFEDLLEDDDWLSQLTFVDRTEETSGWFHSGVSISLWSDGLWHLDLFGEDDEYASPDVREDTMLFTPETWHTIALEVDEKQQASLWMNDEKVTTGQLFDITRTGIVGWHTGPINGGENFPVGGYILIDNLELTCW